MGAIPGRCSLYVAQSYLPDSDIGLYAGINISASKIVALSESILVGSDMVFDMGINLYVFPTHFHPTVPFSWVWHPQFIICMN